MKREVFISIVVPTVFLTIMMGISVGLALGETYPEETKKILQCMGARK
jgi:hypothetical protein